MVAFSLGENNSAGLHAASELRCILFVHLKRAGEVGKVE